MSRSRLEVLVESPLTTVATFEETVITVVRSELTMESLVAGKQANARLYARYKQGTSALIIVHPGIRMPDAELRRASAEAMAATRTTTRASARVFLGDGFWLSSVRSVLTAIELLRPYDVPKRTFADVRTASSWLAQSIHAEGGWAARLQEAVSDLEAGSAPLRVGAAT
jgi:hypothetical protein